MNQQCVSCGPVSAISSPTSLCCPKCGGRLTDKCPVCKNHHAIGTAYCVGTGKSIAKYKTEERRKEALKKEYDQKFPDKFWSWVKYKWTPAAVVVNLVFWLGLRKLGVYDSGFFPIQIIMTPILGVFPLMIRDGKRERSKKKYVEENL